MKDYLKSKIYKLESEDGRFYIGSTTNEIEERYKQHIYASKRDKNRKVYSHFNQLGWDKVTISCLEEYPCASRKELQSKEDEYIQQNIDNELCLNMRINVGCENYHQQYFEKNKEKRKEQMKTNYEQNKEERFAKMKEYEDKNKEKLKQYRKEYAEKNREKIREYHKQWYAFRKELRSL